MTISRIVLAAAVAVLTACSAQEPTPEETALVVDFDAGTVLAITAEFAINKGMNELCQGDGYDHLTPFLEEMEQLQAPPDLTANAKRVSDEMLTMIRDEEPEYVCTPEMFESAAARVAEAEQDWSDMKGGGK